MRIRDDDLKILFNGKPEIERLYNDVINKKIDKSYVFDDKKDEVNAFIKLCGDERMFETFLPENPEGIWDNDIQDYVPQYDEEYIKEQEKQIKNCTITLKLSAYENEKTINLYELISMIYLGRGIDNNSIENQKDLQRELNKKENQFKNEFIDKNATRGNFKDLINSINHLYAQTPHFAIHYNLYDLARCDFSTAFKYPNGKNVCIGDIIKVKSHTKDPFDNTFSLKSNEETFIVKFDYKGEDGCYLQSKEHSKLMSYLKDEPYKKKVIEKICNIYEYKRGLEKDYEYTQELNIDENLSKDIQMRQNDSDVFYNEHTILNYQFDDETFKLYHNQINEFIGLCKKGGVIENFINSTLGKRISENVSITLYDSGYGFGGAKIETIKLNDLIALAMKKDITNQNELISQIGQHNTQSFWESFEKDLLAISKQIKDYEKDKAVLIPEAKQRIPKEILAKLDKLNKDYQCRNLYKSDENKYQIKNTQALENIAQFYRTHTQYTQSRTQ